MVPRKRLDVSCAFLARAFREIAASRDINTARTCAEAAWGDRDHTLALYSVRTGFDLLLQALGLDARGEVLLTAVNIPDFPRIIAHHGLSAIPVDIDTETLAPRLDALENAWSPRVRVLVVAHLFGARVAMQPIVDWCRARGVFLVEDAAQAYGADAFRGHPASDARFFSFGPVKTETALGGALALIKDGDLARRMRAIESGYPTHPRRLFLRRTALFSIAHILSHELFYGLLVRAVERQGGDLDEFLARSVLRAFYAGDFWNKLRRRAPAPMLSLLAHRVLHPGRARIARRIERAERLIARMPKVMRPGRAALDHVHWVLPVLSDDPIGLKRALRGRGFDASRAVSSLVVFDPPADRPGLAPTAAHATMERLIYLPFDARMTDAAIDRLAAAVVDFEARRQASIAPLIDRRPAA